MEEESFLQQEQHIVEQAKTDDAAFEHLYNYYFPKIYGYVYKRCGSKEIAEDLVSIVFMKVVKSLPSYKYQGYSFKVWIYRIATNTLTDHYRKQAKKKEISIDQEETFDPVDYTQNPTNDIQRKEEQVIVQYVLCRLSKRYQEILHLKFFAEMGNTEIAKVLQIKPNNAGVLIHRALQSFSTVYKEVEQERNIYV